jgi:hypothetical protein
MVLPHNQHGRVLALHLRLNAARSSLYRRVDRPAYLLVDVTYGHVFAGIACR